MNREAGSPARTRGGRELSPGASWPRRCEALFEDLRRPARAMVARAYGRALSDEEIEDVYSAAWAATLAALRDRGAAMADEELRAYVLTAVASHAGKEMRRRSRKPSAALSESAEQVVSDRHLPLPDEVAAGLESRDVARDLLASLPRRRRAVMLLRYGWGLSPGEVCELVEGLSPRAYRKEITRGVEQLIGRLGEVESGEWCAGREPLVRDLVAGVADEETERQARRHLRHCRGCAELARRLGTELHDLGGTFALAATASSLAGAGFWGRLSELADGAREAVTSLLDQTRGVAASLLERGETAIGSVAGSGVGRGAGATSSGLAAKLAGVGGAGKVALACAGAGAAATACVAAGVVPGVALPGADGEEQQRPRAQRIVAPLPPTRMIDAIGGQRISLPASKPAEPDEEGREDRPGGKDDESSGSAERGSSSGDEHPAELPASVREFDPMVAGAAGSEAVASGDAGAAPSPPQGATGGGGSGGAGSGGAGGGGGSATARSEFGP